MRNTSGLPRAPQPPFGRLFLRPRFINGWPAHYESGAAMRANSKNYVLNRVENNSDPILVNIAIFYQENQAQIDKMHVDAGCDETEWGALFEAQLLSCGDESKFFKKLRGILMQKHGKRRPKELHLEGGDSPEEITSDFSADDAEKSAYSELQSELTILEEKALNNTEISREIAALEFARTRKKEAALRIGITPRRIEQKLLEIPELRKRQRGLWDCQAERGLA
ncbi:hypothetical protein [Thiomonas arsenitoxydans]|uniref:Uncharacterized protein n=1 Tax=Thiomonas arsenitoxydans (strain DSM 22701 / CIP 110005 / 3As) TaxID=426114 RepID=D6CQ34_THIA3|nr:hypothetical protein [Thiomonas arsenitoxydans]CAZ88114.1 hypothetical protein THI_1429 [Thiomonas arsenitoxydans]